MNLSDLAIVSSFSKLRIRCYADLQKEKHQMDTFPIDAAGFVSSQDTIHLQL